MESRTVETAGLPAVLRDSGRWAWVRALLGPVRRGVAPLYYAHVVIGRQPPNWDAVTWRYESCTFTAAKVDTAQLARACGAGTTDELALGTVRAAFALTPGVYNWRRDPSRARFDELGIRWPTLRYDVPIANAGDVRLPEFLIGRGCPSFPANAAAFTAFFYGNFSSSGA